MTPDIRQALRSCDSWPDLRSLIADVRAAELGSRDVEAIHRAVGRLDREPDVKVAYLASHTIDMLPRHASAHLALEGLQHASHVGAFNQYFQEVLRPESPLIAFAPDLVFLSLTVRTVAERIERDFLGLSTAERRAERERLVEHVAGWAEAARQNTGAVLLIANFPRPAFNQAGIADARLEYGETEWYLELNLELLRAFRADPRVCVFDLDQALARTGRLAAEDPKMLYLAKTAIGEQALPAVAEELVRHVKAVKGRTGKCLVLDLDNTVWGGIVGEDGVDGLKIGADDPVGEAFADFQSTALALKRRGIVLAAASKNNPEDALEVFEKRPEMRLARDDFSVMQIGWGQKHESLTRIAQTLNIGIDSLVFLDDNPVERGIVREMLPEVLVPELPADPGDCARMLRRSTAFEKLRITEEDVAKAQQYAQNAQRTELKENVGDIGSFLERLGTKVIIERAGPSHVSRVHQMFNKTNQFNVTTRRYSVGDIEKFLEEDAWDLRVMSVSDTFGDLGIVALCLVERRDGQAVIDSFLMSCRALGREAETALMNEIKRDYLGNGRAGRIESEFIRTAKNRPAEHFFDTQGFRVIDGPDDARRRYRLEAAEAQLKETPGITVVTPETGDTE